ncbi:hypothetical protein ACFV6E_34640 [Streptomyces sp. NPDC059785]|uniref:hypothetical protein n=1 Tax=unclassified Streptomyces TaxID=2593676 RepID=UPI003667AAE1
MAEHVSILQVTVVAVVLLGTALWVAGAVRLLRRGRPTEATSDRKGATSDRSEETPGRPEEVARRRSETLRALPRQRRVGPAAESVELSSQERAAFAALIRQFSDSHRR